MKLTIVDYVHEVEELIGHLKKPGLLLVVPDTKRSANAMAIGWATFGRIWGQPMCTVMVRPSRYTFGLLNRSGVFTVNLMPAGLEEAVRRCGQVSGRDVDKIVEHAWALQPGMTGPAPYLAEAQLHLECRVVFTTKVTGELVPELLAECYPKGDFHTLYFGQVTGAFLHE